MSEEHERLREEETAERETLEALASALKDVRPFHISLSLPLSHMTKQKVSSLQSQLQDRKITTTNLSKTSTRAEPGRKTSQGTSRIL